MDKNVDELQDLFNSELMTNSIPISNPESLYLKNNQNTIKENKNYKEDIINTNNKQPKTIKESKISKESKLYDLNKIFSDDDMSLNKSNKLLKQNSTNNKNINISNKNNISTNSLVLSLNINEIQLEDNNDIKKIIPSEIYNYIRYSGNQLINNTKEGLKKLFIYLSDSLNNQKKINGSNDYYYNNDLNSENLLKIYIYIINIINKNENKADIINEGLFIINLILPLLPTMYLNNICVQLIEKFYYKTALDELSKNNYLLFKQILRLNQDTFFDKVFSYLNDEKNMEIKKFWKKFIFDLIQKNNENCGIGYFLENNENVINIINEYHKVNLVNFCIDLFDNNYLDDINSNKDAIELIKCINENKILSNSDDKEGIKSFKEMLMEKTKLKNNDALNVIISNIFNGNNKGIKVINLEDKKISNDFGSKNNLNSGSNFLGSFGTFNANKNNNFLQKNEINIINDNNKENNNNNNFDESMEKYKNNDIFEVMDNNIIYDNNKENNILIQNQSNKKEENPLIKDSKGDNLYLYSDKEEESQDENKINKNNKDDPILNYRDKNSGDSVVNYKSSISNKEIMNMNNQKNEKKSINNKNNNMNVINNNKNPSKRTSKISEYYEYFNNKRNTLNNNNLFSSFSSFSSVKRNSNDIKNNNGDIDENDEIIEDKNIIDNNNFMNLINNKKDNKETKNNNNINDDINENIDLNKANNNIINNENFLDLINNKSNKKKISKEENNNIIKINHKKKDYNNLQIEKEGFDYEKCLNIIDKEKWSEKQEQIKLLKGELDSKLNKDNYNNSDIPIDSIINLITKKLNDKQQKLVILMLEVLEVIINKLNEIFNDEYLPILSKSLINNLNDNNIQLRYKAATVILKILSFNKRDFFINQLIESLKIDKNNMRIEILTILYQYFSTKNSSSKKSNKNYFELLVEPLILCIEDKFNKIRNLSEELIKESSKYISIEKYYEAAKRLHSKVFQDKIITKIKEIYGLIEKDELKKSIKSISSIIDNSNELSKSKKKKGRSKSFDINIKDKYVKKNVNKNINNDKNKTLKNKNMNDNQKNNNKLINKEEKEIDYKNIFKKNQNFIELKKYRNNKDIKLNKNFLSIKEKANILINNKNINSNNPNELKPLFQIFTNDFINQAILPSNKDLNLIIFHLNKILLFTTDKNFKSDFLPNLDTILEFIIRLFDKNLLEKKFDFISTYITFINNLCEKLVKLNLKLSQIEFNIIIQSLIYLAKYNKKDAFNCVKNFFKIITIDKTFRILFDYNDLNDIDTQKNIIELFKLEFNQGNIDISNDNFLLAKRAIKFFYKEELLELGKDFFKDMYTIIGDKNFEEFISKLNKQEKNILLKNIDFFILKDKNKENKENKKKINITEFKIDLSNMVDSKTLQNKDNNTIIKDIKPKKLINKDNNTIIENPKVINKQKEINNINELNEILIELNSNSDEFNIEYYNKENDKNNKDILSNKIKLVSSLKDLFSEINYPKNKNILIESIELILDSLSQELNFFLNINTMIEDCAFIILNYIQEIISLFLLISSKQELILILKENILNKLIILFLNYLEIDKEEGISGLNETFSDMIQKINKITLNIIQKAKRDLIIIILIRLISNFKEESDMALLAINCLVKLIKITNFKKCNIVEILSEIIIAVDDENLFNENNYNKANELFIKSIKKLLNQLVLEKKYNILKDYQMAINKCNIQDEKVSEWIQKILEHNKF